MQQIEVAPEHGGSLCKLLAGINQRVLRFQPLSLNLAESNTDLVAGKRVVRCKIEKALLLQFELGELLLNRGMDVLDGQLLLIHRSGDVVSKFSQEVARQHDRRVVAFDGLLDLPCREVRQVAELVLATSADEIFVTEATPAGGFGIDETTGPPRLVASIAEQPTLEIVRQYSVALATLRALIHDLLHPVEQSLADKRFMPTRERLSFVGDHACVVRVAQHLMQLVERHRL